MGDRLKGRVAVVTGSGQGIGKAIAIAMAKEGAKVVTNNRRPGSTGLSQYGDEFAEKLSPEEKELARQLSGDAETVAKEIVDMGGEAVGFFGDVSDFKTAGRLIQTAVDNFGKVDILVNQAGASKRALFWEMSEEDWKEVIVSKLNGSFNCSRYAAPLMKEQGWGRIINCSSPAWLGGGVDGANYAAANAGIVAFTKVVARALHPYGVTCNAFCPSAFTRWMISMLRRTKITAEAGTPTQPERMRSEIAPPEAVAPFIVYLATDEAAYISGTAFRVSGGQIAIYSEPEEKKVIDKGDGLWTVDELVTAVPKELLEGYKSPVA